MNEFVKKKIVIWKVFFFLIFFVFLLLFNYEKQWYFFGNIIKFTSVGVYEDLRLLLRGVDIYREGKDPFLANYTPPYNYPSFWKYTSKLSFFNSKNLHEIAFISIIFVLLLYLSILPHKLGAKNTFYSILLVLSPVSLLIFERANSDLIIFSILAVGILVSKRSILFFIPFILVSIFLKIFPVGCVLAIILWDKKIKFNKVYIFSLVATVITALMYFSLNFNELKTLKKNTPFSLNELAYGFSLPVKILVRNNHLQNIESYFMILYVILVAVLYYFFSRMNKITITNFNSNLQRRFFFLGAGAFLFSFFVAINWEYRLFFLMFCLPYFFKLNSKLLLTVVFIVFWNQTLYKIFDFVHLGDKFFFLNQFIILFLSFMIIEIIRKNLLAALRKDEL